jgi:SAM-dependent methyltransferase
MLWMSAEGRLQLGCGTGASLVEAAPAVPGGLVAGVDLSAAALARTAEALGAATAGLAPPPAVLCLQADLKAPPLPLADGAFDRVLCHNLVFASEDLELTRRLVRDYCDTQQPWMDAVDGTIGRRHLDRPGRPARPRRRDGAVPGHPGVTQQRGQARRRLPGHGLAGRRERLGAAAHQRRRRGLPPGRGRPAAQRATSAWPACASGSRWSAAALDGLADVVPLRAAGS